ncbi:MAG TPA: hypothetical protein VFR32_03000, partial [Gaiellaceae bacterium]|nr:hypothetical protein [Gaiellaceae bacterium]
AAVPPGTWVGRGVLSLGNVGSEPAIAVEDGRIVADDPARYATDSCAPGAHAAVWLLSLMGLEQEHRIPLFVDATGNRLRIQFCMPDLRPLGGRFLILGMSLTGVIALPSATGRYVWSAHVTPFAPDGPAGDPAAAYELRSGVLVPHRLTIRARYDLDSDVAVLRGRLTGAAQARAGVKVFFAGFTGPNFSGFRMLGSARTDAKGAYVFRARIAERTTFVAAADARAKPCSNAPSTAPFGCLAETTSPPPSVSAAIAPGG